MTTEDACQLIVEMTHQLALARGERDAYRELVSVALTKLHDMTGQLERERASRYRLLEEFRALRERGRKATAA